MPNNKYSSGPCAKFFEAYSSFDRNILGRSHRSNLGLHKIQEVMALIRECAEIPSDYKLAIVAGGGTGAMEILLWNLCGQRPIDVLQYGVFSKYWARDLIDELSIPDVRVLQSDLWTLQHKDKVDFEKDLVLCWTETTTGVSINSSEFIPDDRPGLVISDITAAIFCEKLDWSKIDAASFSWQKGLGGEAGLGCIVLNQRAIARLQSYVPQRAVPRLYRISDKGNINWEIFDGKTINTPSMLCIEDYRLCLEYALRAGGLSALIQRVHDSYQTINNIIASQNKVSFMVKDENYRAKNVIVLDYLDSCYKKLSEQEQWSFLKERLGILDNNQIAYDILGHVWTKPNIRIWNGPTIEKKDLANVVEALVSILI